MAAKFYIYAFWDEDNNLAYIGKGSGKRFQTQKRRMARKGYTQGKILEWVEDEIEAYEREQVLVARKQPYANANRGGAGGFSGARRASRPAVARLLLNKGVNSLRAYLSDEQIERLKAVARYRTTPELEAAENGGLV